MPDVIKGGYTCECGWVGNSRQAKYWHKHNTCPNIGKAATPSPIAAAMPVPASIPTQSMPEPAAGPLLTPKQQFEKEHHVIIPDLEIPGESEDIATFDGESPEIPVVLIWVIAAVILLIAGAVVFREKLAGFFKGKPPAYSAPQDIGMVPL